MTAILALFSGWWNWILAALAILAAFLASYFGGKKVGTVQTQAKADVDAAQKDQQLMQKSSDRQTEIIRVVKDAQQESASDSDSAARQRMRESGHYSKD